MNRIFSASSRLMRRLVFGGGRRQFSSSSPSYDTVAFLGLGNMGLPMAVNLATKSDYTVVAFDVSTDALNSAEKAGIRVAPSLEGIMDNPQTPPSMVITMLPSDAAVDSVMSILSSNAPPNTSFIDCSTVSPTTSRQWHDALAEKGCLFVDAPVSGGVKGAKDATLTFMVGSDSAKLAENWMIHCVLSYMGSRIIPCGGPGSGAAVKLCNNLALAAQMAGICEAMNLGEALGVDPNILSEVMNTSTAKSWSCEVNNPHPTVAAATKSPASKDYQGGFSTKLMLKDLQLAVGAGRNNQVALPIGCAISELYNMADLRGLGDKDFGVLLQFLRGK
ncbi:3-hydroxyisobutyrate dehydrogenase [Nitzschia inconspicua]|uniref:3-hydroxyisobutyrate dehydrogenase n=1 Tax=Nitzschia inconspicua TaxID=303405 RepID=A0A9K3KEQ8_9STRA|nr:3-hydroxyisobutyrate dehydrogenase [Nitzschia inconspicua]